MPKTHTFQAKLDRISTKGGSHLVVVPQAIADEIRQGERRGRAMVTLDDTTWHAGLNPYGQGQFYVQVGRNYFEPLGYELGDILTIKIERDESQYGMQPCEEYLAVAAEDPAGVALFHQLTGGTQRSILHRIANGNSPDARVARAIRIFDQLHLGVKDRQTLLQSIRADAMRGSEELLDWG